MHTNVQPCPHSPSLQRFTLLVEKTGEKTGEKTALKQALKTGVIKTGVRFVIINAAIKK